MLNRREFLGMAAAGVLATAGAGMGWAAEAAGRRLNVVHIMADDLRACMSCYGHPMVKTPNIDRLASRGVRFELAYCQYPLCNPSRASYMAGLRPDTTKVYENQTHFREVVPDAVTLPQSFLKAGYSVARVGKIYHYGVPRQIGTSGLDDPPSWERVVNPRGRDVDDIGMVEVLQLTEDGKATTVTGKELTDVGGTLSWLAAEGGDSEQTDGKGAASAEELLEEFSKGEKPFYLAVGFYRPHTPFIAPKPYFGLYDREAIEVPQIPPNLEELFPKAALANMKKAEVAMSDDLRRQALQAYYASTTFMDAQVGHVLDAIDRLKLADSTVVVFHSDHGYNLGERNLWQKRSLFEESARVPLIIAAPGIGARGGVCKRPVELVSLHKTLADLCGIAADVKTEGYSLRPLVEDPGAKWDHPAFTQVDRSENEGGSVGRSVRTERWRYTEWDEGRSGAELYDHDSDPREMRNLATDPEQEKVVAELRALLRAGGE